VRALGLAQDKTEAIFAGNALALLKL
jgi:hypothetical protein